jgi:hypothetical protein
MWWTISERPATDVKEIQKWNQISPTTFHTYPVILNLIEAHSVVRRWNVDGQADMTFHVWNCIFILTTAHQIKLCIVITLSSCSWKWKLVLLYGEIIKAYSKYVKEAVLHYKRSNTFWISTWSKKLYEQDLSVPHISITTLKDKLVCCTSDTKCLYSVFHDVSLCDRAGHTISITWCTRREVVVPAGMTSGWR